MADSAEKDIGNDELAEALVEAMFSRLQTGTAADVFRNEIGAWVSRLRTEGKDPGIVARMLLSELTGLLGDFTSDLMTVSGGERSSFALFQATLTARRIAEIQGAAVALVPLPVPLAKELEEALEALAYGEIHPLLRPQERHGKKRWSERKLRLDAVCLAHYHKAFRKWAWPDIYGLIAEKYGISAATLEDWDKNLRKEKAPEIAWATEAGSLAQRVADNLPIDDPWVEVAEMMERLGGSALDDLSNLYREQENLRQETARLPESLERKARALSVQSRSYPAAAK